MLWAGSIATNVLPLTLIALSSERLAVEVVCQGVSEVTV